MGKTSSVINLFLKPGKAAQASATHACEKLSVNSIMMDSLIVWVEQLFVDLGLVAIFVIRYGYNRPRSANETGVFPTTI